MYAATSQFTIKIEGPADFSFSQWQSVSNQEARNKFSKDVLEIFWNRDNNRCADDDDFLQVIVEELKVAVTWMRRQRLYW